MHFIHTVKKYLLHTGIMLLPAGLAAQGIYISGAHLVMNGAAHLVLNNAGITNNGIFTAGNSTIWITGNNNALTGFINAAGNMPTFYNMVINRQGSSVQFNQSVHISNALNMNSGNILLNGYTLYLDVAASIIGENEASHITGGSVSAIRILTAPAVGYNPGNIGVDITTSAKLGLLWVTRTHVPVLLPNGWESIKRVFTITSTINTGVNATLKFHYLNAELNGNSEAALSMYNGIDTSASGWELAGRDSFDIINKTVTKTGINKLNRFTLVTQTDQPILVTPPVARQATKAGDINENISEKIQVYPVPAHDYFIVTVANEHQQQSEFLLFDEVGHLLQRKKVFLLSGINNISWDISGYPAGVYYMTFDKGKANKFKIIKQ